MKYIVLLVVLSVCAPLGLSIRCYECNSANNSMCLDPTTYDKETLNKFIKMTDCANGVYSPDRHQFFCRKIVQTIFHKHHDSEVRVTRGCGWVRHHRDCYKADNEDHLETVCQCFTDDCNAATVPSYSQWVGLAALSILGLRSLI
ncbi:hypothetical protein ABMA28_005418 [Loxostege sticticalis]|uniref:Protein sleepless n=1 Tax=Loxostege sticticalis TaxID=481309 RepID=A0ABD0SQD0_LOXSC